MFEYIAAMEKNYNKTVKLFLALTILYVIVVGCWLMTA